MHLHKITIFVLVLIAVFENLSAGIDHRLAKIIINEHKYRPIEGTVLMIGRQTISLTPDQAIALVKSEGLSIRPNAKIEIDKTTYGSQNYSLISDRSFFSLFSDANVLALDVSPYEGAEIIANLNQPLEDSFHNIADFIYNGSCLDNLFDPASALKNISRLLKPGGRVIHIEHGSPVQGAYIMYSPPLFFDYFAINEFTDCRIYALLFQNFGDPWYAFLWEAFGQSQSNGQWLLSTPMHYNWPNILTLVIAEKGELSTCDISPIQGVYRQEHKTDTDIYFNAFQRYKASMRPQLGE